MDPSHQNDSFPALGNLTCEHWGTCEEQFRLERQQGNTLTVHNVTTKIFLSQKNLLGAVGCSTNPHTQL